MLEARWMALGVVAVGAMVVWAVVLPDRRVYLSAGTSFIAFAVMALTAPGVERLTETGSTVAAPVSEVVQVLIGVFAVLSLAVVFLYRFDEYPPEEIEPP